MSSSASAWTGVKRANALSATVPTVINSFEVFMFPLESVWSVYVERALTRRMRRKRLARDIAESISKSFVF
jgi:hypothetical protein